MRRIEGITVTRPARRPSLMLQLLVLLGLLSCLAPARSEAADGPPPPTIAECAHRYHRPCMTPALVQAYYGVAALLRRGIRGQGRTIAVVDSSGSATLESDLHFFDRAFGLPDPQLTILAPLGKFQPKNSGWDAETTLDVEWAHAMAPDAHIVVLESPVDETEGVQGLPQFLKLEQYALQHHLADVISQSWGATEDTLLDAPGRRVVAQFHQLYAAAARSGVTVIAGSGDDGAGGIDRSLRKLYPYPVVGYPASDPLVLAVGGTALALTTTGTVLGETGWPLSGGGVSKLFPEPAYQKPLPPPVQQLLRGHRGVPDVAFNASSLSAVLIYLRGQWHPVAGTSAAAPQWAGLVALADGMAGRDLGLLNPTLYGLACSGRYTTDFRDVTSGDSKGPNHNGLGLGGAGFRATSGWDAVTGLGSPRAASLLPDVVRTALHPTTLRSNGRTGACSLR
jgi:subtilase family serine protease